MESTEVSHIQVLLHTGYKPLGKSLFESQELKFVYFMRKEIKYRRKLKLAW